MRKRCGVYMILNIKNNKAYIGSSNNLRQRKLYHFRELRRNNHPNDRLQKAFNYYGEKNFVFKVIEYTDDANKYTREQYYIDKFKTSDRNIGYNICPKAGGGYNPGELNGMYGKTHTEEVKQKLSELFRGSGHVKSKHVNQYDLNGNFIATYGSAREAAKAVGIRHTQVIQSCKGKYKTGSGYIWLYAEDADIDNLMNRLKRLHEKPIHNRDDRIEIIQLDRNFKFIAEYKSISDAGRITNLDISSICSCCKGRIKTCGGYIFVYKSDYVNGTYKRDINKRKTFKKVVKLTPKGKFIREFRSLKDAASDVSVDQSCISDCCRGKIKTSGGYKWMYAEEYYKSIS